MKKVLALNFLAWVVIVAVLLLSYRAAFADTVLDSRKTFVECRAADVVTTGLILHAVV